MRPTGLTVLLVFAGFTAVILFSVAGVSGGLAGDAPSEALSQSDVDADSIEMDATIHPDGDADWRVVYRLELDDDDEIEAFESLQADLEANQSAYLDPFEDRIERTVESAETATQREMSAGNFSVSAERTVQPDTEFGAVVFEYEWTGFAAVEDDGARIHAGDALDSLFLEEQTSLTLRWDEAYQLDSHTPQASTEGSQRLTWRGPLDFDTGEPRLSLVPTDEGASGADAVPSTPVLLVGLAAAVVVVGLWLVSSQRRQRPTGSNTETGTDEATTSTDEPEQAGVPSELLSNEERVLALLEQHDGRLKQKKVAETLDWSAAKTSQVVGTLREDGEVETFRIGRENVLTLPDVGIVDDQTDDSNSEERRS